MSRVRHAGLSDPGRTHEVNEDRWLALPDQGLYIVADGMANDIASQRVVDLLPHYIAELRAISAPFHDPIWTKTIREWMKRLNQQIHETMMQAGILGGLGTTLVMLIVRENTGQVVHVGDSRAYLFRDAKLERLTRDHSVFEAMVDQGVVHEDDAVQAANTAPIQFLGMSMPPRPDLRTIELKAGDRILLCSDGLTNMVNDEVIANIFRQEDDPENLCKLLVDAANAAGGEDNITVVVVAVEEE